MLGEFIKGDGKDVVAELQAEAQKYKGITVGEWLKKRKAERDVEHQLEWIQEFLKKRD